MPRTQQFGLGSGLFPAKMYGTCLANALGKLCYLMSCLFFNLQHFLRRTAAHRIKCKWKGQNNSQLIKESWPFASPPSPPPILDYVWLFLWPKGRAIKLDTILLPIAVFGIFISSLLLAIYVAKFWPKNHKNCNQNAGTIYDHNRQGESERGTQGESEREQVLITSKRGSGPEAAATAAAARSCRLSAYGFLMVPCVGFVANKMAHIKSMFARRRRHRARSRQLHWPACPALRLLPTWPSGRVLYWGHAWQLALGK